MALSGIQIYKLLPQTNCKDCDFPTCLAFAMKLAAKQVELSLCPHVSDDSQEKLSEAATPPVRPITLNTNGNELKVGNEVVMYRHEKTFYSKPGLFVRVYDDMSVEEIRERTKQVEDYVVDYVGISLSMSGMAIQANGGEFQLAVEEVQKGSSKPLILIGSAEDLRTSLPIVKEGSRALLCSADSNNWEAMASLAIEYDMPLAVTADNIDTMVDLSLKIQEKGVKDVVLAPEQRGGLGTLTANTLSRRMALKKNFKALGFPIINFPGDVNDPAQEVVLVAQAIGKYANFIILDTFSPETAYPLLVLRENIYTDPQKPIQVQPGIYEINDPKPEDPVLVTTNFSITYFSVANEVESSGLPAWLLVTESEGMSVLTAWAAGKFDAERIAKDVKLFGVADKITNKRIVLPGHVAVLSGELEEELPDWEILVGPREAVDLPSYMKNVLVN